ncbi:MAG TPA: hypothetical protein VNJ29_03330 [Candidatus Nitrosotenuis sp.]|nr:hypothetical protein [Candidatus Nitrosotenuis sp.]
MSRPEAKIDWEKVDELLTAGCLGTEVAAYFGVHPNTLYNRVKEKYNCDFCEFSQGRKSKGEALLRVQQFDKALGKTRKGDTQLLLMLGRERLGQRQEKESHDQPEKSITLKVNFDGNPVQVLPEAVPTSNSESSQ